MGNNILVNKLESNMKEAAVCFVVCLLLCCHCCQAVQRDQYIGCYKDDLTKPLGNDTQKAIVKNLTPELCFQRCSRMGYAFSGLQDGDECHCGRDVIDGNRIRESECDKKCEGNLSEMCGGNKATSIYSTCQPGETQLYLTILLLEIVEMATNLMSYS